MCIYLSRNFGTWFPRIRAAVFWKIWFEKRPPFRGRIPTPKLGSFLRHVGSPGDPNFGVAWRPSLLWNNSEGRQATPKLGSPGDPTTRKNDPRFGVGIRPQNGGRFSDQISQKIAVRILENLWVKGRLATLKLGAFFQRGCHRNSAADSGDSRCQACGLVHASWGGRCERAWPPSGLLSWVMLAPSSPRLVVVRWRGNRGFGCTMARKTRAHVRGVTRLETYG